MSETPLQGFIDLINFDQTILATEKSIASLKQEILDLREQEKLNVERLEKIMARTLVARKEVDSIELDIKTMDSNERTKKERLENSTDYKQYQSLKNEIDHIKTKQVKLEESLIDAWSQLEAAQKELETVKKEASAKQDEILQQINQKDEKIKSLEKELEKFSLERNDKVKIVPQEWLEKYAMMRSRVSNPVVPVHQGSCGACFYNITEQDLMQLRRRKLLQCKGCFRLLFSEEFEKEAEQST